MAERHFLRTEFAVRLGGWRAWRWRFGAGRYTVGPVSTLRALQLWGAVGGFVAEPDAGVIMAQVRALVAENVEAVKPYLPLLVREPVRARDIRCATRNQILDVLVGIIATNDVGYILDGLLRKPGSEKKAQDGGTFRHVIVSASQGAYTHHEVGDLPFQEALAIVEATDDARAEKPDDERDWRDPTPEEYEALRRAGIVN